jgi:NADPH-dependent ferric siderophore reductase
MSAADDPTRRVRREPPRWRQVSVAGVEPRSPRLVRVTFTGPELTGFTVDAPAASVRLLLPSPGRTELVVPEWNGNEFLLPDGTRPVLRTFTPLRAAGGGLAIDVVQHPSGVAAAWAAAATPDTPAAVSGPGRGYPVDPAAPAYLLAGDESAIPAVGQLLEVVPGSVPVEVHLEVDHPDAAVALPDPPGATVTWHVRSPDARPGDALLAAVSAADLPPGIRVWVAGEAAGVQRIRQLLFAERGVPRAHASVRGYWKHGRSGGDDG